jgi:hypothetical protein
MIFFSNDGLTFGDIIDVINPRPAWPTALCSANPSKGLGILFERGSNPLTIAPRPLSQHAQRRKSPTPQISARLSNQLTLLAA